MQRVKWILIALLPLEFLSTALAKSNPDFIEEVYARWFYPIVSMVLRVLFGWLPLPVGQVTVGVLFVLLCWWLFNKIRLLRMRRLSLIGFLWQMLLNGTALFSLIYLLFLISWGFNYYRKPLFEQWNLSVNDIEIEELIGLNKDLIVRCNELREEIGKKQDVLPISKVEILESAYLGYNIIDTISLSNQSLKAALFPVSYSYLSIGGIYSMITGEANINMHPPNYLTPFTACHEIAHQLGYASEQEANFLGYLATQRHPNISFQYSGSLAALRYTMRSLYWTDSVAYLELSEQISERVKKDLANNAAYWEKFDNPIDRIGSIIYDYYLKANAQNAGIRSYGMVTRLLVGYERRKKATNAVE